MKNVQSYVAAFLALLVFGCGGSGGGSSTTGSTTDLSKSARIEAVVRVERSNLMHPDKFSDDQLADPTNAAVKTDLINKAVFGYQDPANLQTGERYIFQLVAYPHGVRTVLPATFQTQDLTSTYGNLGSNSGAFDASNQTSTSDQVILAFYNGLTYSTTYDVRERQARVIGNILQFGSNTPVEGAAVDFFDSNGLVVGTATSAHDGSFRASIPQSAVTFSIDPHSLKTVLYFSDFQPAFFGVYTYGGLTYASGSADCRTPLPALTVGSQGLSTIFLTAMDGKATQPPTSGCPG